MNSIFVLAFVQGFIFAGCVVLLLTSIAMLVWWVTGGAFKKAEMPEEQDREDDTKNFAGWSKWHRVWISDYVGSWGRDRFSREADGAVRHFVQYFGKSIDRPGPGTDMTETDLKRGWFKNMEEMAMTLGCEIIPAAGVKQAPSKYSDENAKAAYDAAKDELAKLGVDAEEVIVEAKSEPEVNSGLPKYDENSSRLAAFIKNNEPKHVEIQFSTVPAELKEVLSRHILGNCLRFIVEMYEQPHMPSFWSAIDTFKEVSLAFATGKVELYFVYSEKKLAVGESKIVYEPRYFYFSGFQFIGFHPSDSGMKAEIYKSFLAEYNPPTVEVKLEGVLVSETNVTELWTQDALCSYPFDAQVTVWDWK